MPYLFYAVAIVAALGLMTIGYVIAGIGGLDREEQARRAGEAFGRQTAEFDALFNHAPDLPPLPPEMERLWQPADTFVRALRDLPTELVAQAFNEGVGDETRKGLRP